jgi:phage replication O-like protein O
MSSTPQLEDGFTRIANELMEAILGFGFSHREQSVVFAIIRETYGYGRKTDDMSTAQIGAMCGVARQHVTTTLNALAARNKITKQSGRYGMVVGIQKDHRKWITADQMKAPAGGGNLAAGGSPETGLVPKQDMSQIGTEGTPLYSSWLHEAMEMGDLPLPHGAPDFIEARTAYSRCNWLGVARGWVDPGKEKQGAILGMDAGLSTLQRECAELRQAGGHSKPEHLAAQLLDFVRRLDGAPRFDLMPRHEDVAWLDL